MFKKALLAAALAGAAITVAAPANAALIVSPATIGAKVFATGGDVIAHFEGSTASFISTLSLGGVDIFTNDGGANLDVNLGSFAAGTELIFKLSVSNTGKVFSTGPGSRNPDGAFHAAANTTSGTTFIGFEDAIGGDNDFNDLIFSFTGTGTPGVPEPASWAMMIAGFGMVGGTLRVRARKASLKIA